MRCDVSGSETFSDEYSRSKVLFTLRKIPFRNDMIEFYPKTSRCYHSHGSFFAMFRAARKIAKCNYGCFLAVEP